MFPRPNRKPGVPYSDFPVDEMGNKSEMITHGTPSRYSFVIEGLDGYWAHVERCNSNRDKRKDYLPFIAGQGLHVGFIHPKFAEELKRFPGIFTFSGDKAKGQMVQLNRTLITEKDCTASVEGVMQILANEGKIHSWRNEKYPVVTSFGSPSLFWLERACVPYLGTKAYHTHLNGYTIVDGEMFLWVSIRGDSKMHQDFPGKYDHLVAGGQPVNLTPKENILRYAQARANMPSDMAEKAIPVRTISYEQIDDQKMKRDVIFCYDLEVPYFWQPKNNAGFHYW
ncbi:nudix hydrolase 20, chloroplastic isoform X3 [Physcomitrium patens]|uniref:nudix hydrolase 20, chloroplastic isoform X3 n=1 Tax=Physcomitrium patens TaxID=3218 RepID=UPI003CCD32F3